MADSHIIVTACDSPYSPLASDLVRSIRDKPEIADHPIGLLDLGLTTEEVDRFVSLGVDVRKVGWDLDFPGLAIWQEKLPGYKAMISRSFLPDHFPGYSVYCWMDADTWVQRGEAISHIVHAARQGELIVATELDRQYLHYSKGPAIWQIFRNWYLDAFGEDIANRMNLRPMLNSGVFALSAGAPHWGVWREIYAEGLKRNADVSPAGFMMEQLALNAAVYLRQLDVCLLPARYNWLCHHAIPNWDHQLRMFVEPGLPNDPISIMHLSQKNKTGECDVLQRGEWLSTGKMSLRYPGFSVP